MPNSTDESPPAASFHEEARNLANTHQLSPWLESIAEMKLGPAFERGKRQASCAQWLMTVGRKAVIKSGAISAHDPQDLAAEPEWIQTSFANGRSVHILDLGSYDRSRLERAMDWLVGPAGPAAESDWSRLSLPAALEAEAKWIAEMERQSADARLDGAVALGTRPVPGLDDLARSELNQSGSGYSWVELSNPEALVREGGLMRHCVGIYGADVGSGKTRIFSLRDPAGSPRATVELTRGCFKQLKIKGDNQTDTFCSLAARALIAIILPQIRAEGHSPSCGHDFVKTGYGHSNILGFCDLSTPLDAGGASIVLKWIVTFGGEPQLLHNEMQAAALAGGTSLFDALQPHGGEWWKNTQIVEALFSNESMLPCLAPILANASKRADVLQQQRMSWSPSRRLTGRLVENAIGSGSEEMWDNLLRLDASFIDLLTGIELLSAAPGSIGDADLARFIRWMPPCPGQTFEPGYLRKKATKAARHLAASRFDDSLRSLRASLGQDDFPWTSAATGAAKFDSVGILQWVLEHAPAGQIFADALARAVSRPKSRCLPLLRDGRRIRDHLGAAICEASALGAASAVKALDSAERLILEAGIQPAAYAQGLLDAARLGVSHASDIPLFRSVESLAWLLTRVDNDPACPDLLRRLLASEPPKDKNFQASHVTLLTLDSHAPETTQAAAAAIGALSLKHLGAQDLLDLCASKARHGLDQPALFFWGLAQGKAGIDDILRAGSQPIIAAAAERECDVLFAAAGGSASDLDAAKVTFDKAMNRGCWRMASILAEGDPSLVESMRDALILAVPNAPFDTIKTLLPKCDPKRNNSQALVAAARAGRIDVAKLLAPLCDPKALSSEALRSAAARGHQEMVDVLLPLSDPRSGDSHAMRDALRAGHWDVASQLWPLSDPNSGAGEPLALAARSGDFERMLWMVQHGSDPQAGSSSALRTLITHVPSASNPAFELLWERSNPAHLDSEDLLAAVKANRPEWVEKILPHANPNANACAALRTAAKMGELELMQVLIPATDPFNAESIIKAEGFDDEGESMLLSLVRHRGATPRLSP